MGRHNFLRQAPLGDIMLASNFSFYQTYGPTYLQLISIQIKSTNNYEPEIIVRHE
ncbi:hypothetical protein HanIR_Chr01g0042591 [Helianthus annuus]|nr:hypothetical protein HanIR_Chr01g0042591 [Helianthus annuus]